MDNCPHQTVLVGSKGPVEQAIEILRRRGLIYEALSFDRPYHTPLFQAYAEGLEREFFSRLPIAAPRIDTYSCTTASRYPTDPAAIRELFIAHWVGPVLFRDTVKKMYADGVRVFVEVGPQGNLTAFVDDILRGEPHLAMPSNTARRSGITQLNHLVGVLAAYGTAMSLDDLYARRDPQLRFLGGRGPKGRQAQIAFDEARACHAAPQGDAAATKGRFRSVRRSRGRRVGRRERAACLAAPDSYPDLYRRPMTRRSPPAPCHARPSPPRPPRWRCRST